MIFRILLAWTLISSAAFGVEQSAPEEKQDSIQKVGAFSLRLGATKAELDNNQGFDKFYGKMKGAFDFGVDQALYQNTFAVSLGLRIGYMSTKGTAQVVSSNTPSVDDLSSDLNGPIVFTMVPIKVLAVFRLSPFMARYISIDLWGGVEYLYYQEVRSLASQQSGEDSAPDTTKGERTNTVVGGGLNISLNALDPTSIGSLRSSLGIGFVYLTPFFEIITDTKGEGFDFSRKSLGLGFVFESER